VLEFRNVLDVAYGAYVVKGAYSGVNGMTGAPDRDEVVAIIRELLGGNIAAIRQGAHEASTAISMVQMFAGAADSIGGKLAAMKELAEKASSPDYSAVQVEQMQKEFLGLAEEINETVNSTEYNFNKLFTAEGESISISIGNGSRIDIFAKDLSFGTEGLDLTTDPAGALAKVEKATAELNEYTAYLRRQAARVEDATAIIESEVAAAVGVDLADFSLNLAEQVASYAADQVLQDSSRLLNIQGNVNADRVLQLLKDKDKTIFG